MIVREIITAVHFFIFYDIQTHTRLTALFPGLPG